MELSIVKENNMSLRIILAIIIAIAWTLLILLGDKKTILLVVAIQNLLFLLVNLDRLKFSRIGSFVLLKDEVIVDMPSIKKLNYNFSEISLMISHSNFYPESIFTKTNNFLSVSIQNPEKGITVLILFKNKKEKEDFKNKLEQMYINGVIVKEFDTNGKRSFLFAKNLNYQQIQEIKKKYKISWY